MLGFIQSMVRQTEQTQARPNCVQSETSGQIMVERQWMVRGHSTIEEAHQYLLDASLQAEVVISDLAAPSWRAVSGIAGASGSLLETFLLYGGG